MELRDAAFVGFFSSLFFCKRMYLGFPVFCRASLSSNYRENKEVYGMLRETWLRYCEVESMKMTSLCLMRRPPSLLNPQNPHASQHLHSAP